MQTSPWLAVVDDDAAFCAYLAVHFGARGCPVGAHTSGDEFLACVANGDVPAVVLLDMAMPGAGGMAILRALRETQPDCQVIILSALGEARTIVAALRLGAIDFVVKGSVPDGTMEERLDAVVSRARERAGLFARVAAIRRGATPDGTVFWGGDAMVEVERRLARVSDCDVPVLIRGESGVGKEVVARAIHARSPRARAPFVKINCAALPADLLESELFGHERGAFTGADFRRMGKFEHAASGTVLLDEIGEMSAGLQAKLLHVLQDGLFTRLGSNRPIGLEARILAATHRDLAAMIEEGRFREDLYYRLKVVEIAVPPLRERRDELPGMVDHFLARFSARFGRPLPELTDELNGVLLAYDWPGNVRELENAIKRLVLLGRPDGLAADLRRRIHTVAAPSSSEPASDQLKRADVPAEESGPPPSPDPLPLLPPAQPEPSLLDVARVAAETAERSAIERELALTHWNRRRAADRLGVSYKTLLTKIRELGISGA